MDEPDTAISTNSQQARKRDGSAKSSHDIQRQTSDLDRQRSIRSKILEEHQDVPYGEDVRNQTFISRWLTESNIAKAFQGKPTPVSRTLLVGNCIPPSTEDDICDQKFPNNRIISSKYTAWNFIPKNLFEQFRRIANFYFLCIGIIQLFLEDTPVSPATSILPLIFVVSVTAVKQGYEDYLRHRADDDVNNRPAFIARDGKLVEVRSQDITVGDLVYVTNNEGFPCDLVMLSSSDEEGQCYITTANLDGETNLKIHCCIPESKHLKSVEGISNLCSSIECEQPSADLYRFIGRANIFSTDSSGNSTKVQQPLGPEHMLLRGARLKNTEFIFGCAVYTGQQTKMALNSKFTSAKFSTVEKSMNFFLIVFLVILMFETTLLVVLKNIYERNISWPWYLPPQKPINFRNVLQDLLSFLVLLNYVIPISLYVTLEMQKFFGSMFFAWDLEMYDFTSDIPAKVNTSDLNEELGQVEYLFTDKTGTLTENDMQFRQCSINGTRYSEVGGMLCELSDMQRDTQPLTLSQYTPDMMAFVEVLVLCHTINVHKNPAAREDEPPEYQSSSPDEKALAEACRRLGVTFLGTRGERMIFRIKNEDISYRLLHVLEFDATRKCMSVIVRNPKGEILLLCKGAESTLLPNVISGDADSTLQHVDDFAMAGLRTLVIANKRLSEEELQDCEKQLHKARTAMVKREEKVSRAYSVMEQDLHVLGATGVEDRLQDGVQETIASLRVAGIKVWVLTGDKMETAVNISHSCGHFKRGMHELHLVQQKNKQQCERTITDLLKEIRRDDLLQCALVVDGMSLKYALSTHRQELYTLCSLCTAVLCCRMSPIQKALVVKLVKSGPDHPVTAAIGDGANDVSMIQEAEVGIGIYGKEGRQAVRCSDFAFARFRFLQRALLVHGHYYYYRVATLSKYFFYKNVAFITPQLYFAFWSRYSGQSFYESMYLASYNIFLTSLCPILIYGMFEKHCDEKTLMDDPTLYRLITRNARLSMKEFVTWNLLGYWQSLVFFFGTYFLLQPNAVVHSSMETMDVFCMGVLCYIVIIIAVNLKLSLETHYWTWITHFSLWSTFIGFVGFILFYSSFPMPLTGQTYMYWVVMRVMGSVTSWLIILLLTIAALMPDLLLKLYKNTWGIDKSYIKKVSAGVPYAVRKGKQEGAEEQCYRTGHSVSAVPSCGDDAHRTRDDQAE
ncbi:PREDICTED: probable phospholipid-transporting ATPase IF isoform X3 [Priapulus caudatus]|uniref:Phospholipid-transporting ATPase n=1 Tax=Priapulus caudatus TaxID=37621 RepID=A0ABM1DX75_PRICU|nr:PREDICTED: probable phospholipid-transporting ATPase IF isoform X3 [Priapulus caudatus]